MPMQWTYKNFINSQILIQANCNKHVKFHRDLLIISTSKLSLKNDFFTIFFVRSWFLRSMGAVAQNWLIPQKFHNNQHCRVSKRKIKICPSFVVLTATRKAGNRPRTFYTGLTVYVLLMVRPNLAEPYLVDPHLVAIVSKFPVWSTVLFGRLNYLVDTSLVDYL